MLSVFVFQTRTLAVRYCLYSFIVLFPIYFICHIKIGFYQIYYSISKTHTKLIHMNQKTRSKCKMDFKAQRSQMEELCNWDLLPFPCFVRHKSFNKHHLMNTQEGGFENRCHWLPRKQSGNNKRHGWSCGTLGELQFIWRWGMTGQ